MISYLPDQVITAKVIAVIDGNTILVATSDNQEYLIILDGIDCPEFGQEFAEEAQAYTKKMLLRKKVTITIVGKDRKGNRLGIIQFKGGIFNHYLVREGLAWSRNDQESGILQEEAQVRKVGIWSQENPTPPWIFRRKQSMMAPKSR